MKIFIAFAILIAGISAFPQPEKYPIDFTNERLVSGSIVSAIEDASQAIKDAGLDPLYIERETVSFALPVPVIFNYVAFIEELLSTGLSDIKINRVNYSVITSRLTFDIELPLINFSVGAAFAGAQVFGSTVSTKTSGRVEIHRIRIVGQLRVSIGIISGITIRSINITFTLGDIKSDVNLIIQRKDYSGVINEFLGSTVPSTIKAYHSEINELLEIILLEVINANM